MGVGTSLRICEKWAMNQTESEARFDYTGLSLEYCTLRSIYKPWERFHSIIWASCPLLIYILFTQILGFCFLNVILLLYSFFKIYLSFLNFNFKQNQEFFFFQNTQFEWQDHDLKWDAVTQNSFLIAPSCGSHWLHTYSSAVSYLYEKTPLPKIPYPLHQS